MYSLSKRTCIRQFYLLGRRRFILSRIYDNYRLEGMHVVETVTLRLPPPIPIISCPVGRLRERFQVWHIAFHGGRETPLPNIEGS